MVSLADLLRYKDEIEIKHPKTQKVLATVWIRILGDEDIKEAYKYARIASSAKRKALRDSSTLDYKDDVLSLEEQEDVYLKDLIIAQAENDFIRESAVAVSREELPKLEEVAIEPDAPSLEEQETLDTKTEEVEVDYRKKIDEYVASKVKELKAELDSMSHEDLVKKAQSAIVNVESLRAFMLELRDQKGFRGTYEDKACKKRAFSSLDDFKTTHTSIKEQILNKYQELEIDADDLKD